MEQPPVLQTGPDRFRVFPAHGPSVEVVLAHHTRRGLGLAGVPPLAVATEMVMFLLERGESLIGIDHDVPLSLGQAVGRYPEFVDELRARLG